MKPMLMVLVLALSAATPVRAAENKSPQASEKKRLTVADVLQTLQLDLSQLTHSDEPPGKLRALEGEVTLKEARVKVHVRIELVYTTDLFSMEMKWDPKAVRAAAVRRVSITPIGAAP